MRVNKTGKTLWVLQALILSIGMVFSLLLTVSVQAGNVGSSIPGMGHLNLKVTSIKEARFRKVIKQQYDFSCGSAALATLLSFHYQKPVGEQEVFISMLENGDEEKIQTRGFSLLDMKQFLQRQGFRSNGYKAPLEKLTEVSIPAIALMNLNGYMHFVVVKGVRDDEVLVGDPAFGMKTYTKSNFEKMWNGILFVVTEDPKLALGTFNEATDWRVRHKVPFGTALTLHNLASVSLMAPGANDF